MPTLSFDHVPPEIVPLSGAVERISSKVGGLLEVPAVVGWANHAGVRLETHPLRTHVCASSYDHVNQDLSRERVARLYTNFPQPETVVSLAGQGATSLLDTDTLLRQWGLDLPAALLEPAVRPDELYAAEPRFLLHRVDNEVPLAIAACRYVVTHCGPDRVMVDVFVDAVAVDPKLREQGLAHLVLLEASRWLGMHTRFLRFSDERQLALQQAVHGSPTNALGYQLAQCFLRNYTYFSLSQELIDDACSDRRSELLEPNSVRSGHAVISRYIGVEDMIRIPPDALEAMQATGQDDDEEIEFEAVHVDED